MVIWWLTDGKAGHVAQAQGLFAALRRQGTLIQVVEIPIVDCSRFATFWYWLSQRRLGHLPEICQQAPPPHMILGVGHSTHWMLLLLGRIYPHTRTLILMKPSLPLVWFDLVIMPEHDQPIECETVLATKGVLNPLSNEQRHHPRRVLILIGGASKRHGFDAHAIIVQLQQLLDQLGTQHAVLLTTSRRTPSDFVEQPVIQAISHHVQIFPVDQTPHGWLFEQLQLAESVWVTEDSVSMLYEALTAGCRVGLLSMPRLQPDRITHAVDQLIHDQLVTTLPAFILQQGDLPPPVMLAEADRAADWLRRQLNGKKQ
jgi:uncharacterized protein